MTFQKTIFFIVTSTKISHECCSWSLFKSISGSCLWFSSRPVSGLILYVLLCLINLFQVLRTVVYLPFWILTLVREMKSHRSGFMRFEVLTVATVKSITFQKTAILRNGFVLAYCQSDGCLPACNLHQSVFKFAKCNELHPYKRINHIHMTKHLSAMVGALALYLEDTCLNLG